MTSCGTSGSFARPLVRGDSAPHSLNFFRRQKPTVRERRSGKSTSRSQGRRIPSHKRPCREELEALNAYPRMTGLRIRWSIAGRVVLIAVIGLLALSLLRPPAPPPVPADVGLPKVAVTQPQREAVRPQAMTDPNLGRVVSGGDDRLRAEASEGRARAHSPNRPSARRSAQPKPSASTRRQDPPATAPVPLPEPPPPPVPPPEPPPKPPSPPDDGSMEFAPH